MSNRKTEASWVESRQRWQINVQRNGQRRTFTSSVQGKRGKIEAEQKADVWLEDRTTGENTKLSVVASGYLEHVEAATSHGYWIQQKQYIDTYINPKIGNKKFPFSQKMTYKELLMPPTNMAYPEKAYKI